jgi:hypothetical protein
MTDPTTPDPGTPDPNNPDPALAWTPPPWRPFEASFEEFTGSAEDWANTVTVGVSERYDPVMAHPVDLTRLDAVGLAVALLLDGAEGEDLGVGRRRWR